MQRGEERMFLKLLIALCASVLVGCSSTPSADVTSQLGVGMTKDEVISIMGHPTSTAAKGGAEFMTYRLCTDECWRVPGFRIMGTYYVKLVNGVVESFGSKGDFDSTKTPTVRVEHDENVKISDTRKFDKYDELKRLKDLLDAGVIDKSDFDSKKSEILGK